MEADPELTGRKNENGPTTQSELQIRCGPYQNTNSVFHRTRTNNLKIYTETLETPNGHNNLGGTRHYTTRLSRSKWHVAAIKTDTQVHAAARGAQKYVHVSVVV